MTSTGSFVRFIHKGIGQYFIHPLLGTTIFRLRHNHIGVWIVNPAALGCTPGRFLVDESDILELDKDYFIIECLDVSLLALPLKCECGAEKCKTTHAHWCPMWKELK